jgi:hypothetical protein
LLLKKCSHCLECRTLDNYHKDKHKSDGLKSRCKICVSMTRTSREGSKASKDYWSAWYLSNREELPERQKSCPKRKEYAKRRYKEKGEQIRVSQSNYRKTESGRVLHAKKEAKRRACKLNATPQWLTKKHWAEIENLYWLARDLRVTSGEDYHVDHIVPLKGKNVCGLHVPWNLQILPSDLNISKSNKIGD